MRETVLSEMSLLWLNVIIEMIDKEHKKITFLFWFHGHSTVYCVSCIYNPAGGIALFAVFSSA